jgi:hypothetical protein
MNFGAMAGKLGSSIGSRAEANSQATLGNSAAPQQSPTSAFVQAARQANLERQQAAAMQMQTAPTATAATPGGAMQQTSAPSPVGQGSVPTMQSQGVFSAPSGGMVTQTEADPAVTAAMFRGRY